MTQVLAALALPAGISFFELMRRFERLHQERAPSQGQAAQLRRQPRWLRLEQAAELDFAPAEVQSVELRLDPFDSAAEPELLVRQRHFGLYAPYGPLPVFVTEHAMQERRFERNPAFERFVNLVSAQLAWNHYCAWSALHPVLGYERARNSFVQRLGQLSNVLPGTAATPGGAEHALACRAAWPGFYLTRQRPLAPLRRMLEQYFQVPVQVLARAGRWMAVPNQGRDPRRLGQWRVGRRVLDAQLQAQIVVGPLECQAFGQWKRKSPCVAALMQIANDYTDGHLQPRVLVQIRTRADMAGRLGAMALGHDAWAHPGDSIQTLNVYDAFQEPL
jgi:type VI secretion system protein ImpH